LKSLPCGVNSMEIKLYHMDTLEYSGSIVVKNKEWEFRGVTDSHLISVTKGMPIKALIACLSSFNLVYDIIEE
jgi:hypothetical protein